jgi:EpsI family protein
MVIAALLAVALAPRTVVEQPPAELGAAVPTEFSNWRAANSTLQQVGLFATDENGRNPMQTVYDDSFLRSYESNDGTQMMVAVAYDRVQREEDRVHRPEICYIAQGFHILSDEPVTFHLDAAGNREIEGRRMLAQKSGRLEAVSYWIRIGNSFTQNPWRSRAYVLAEGLTGKLHDGILVRVSQVIESPADATRAFATQERFLDSMLANVSTSTAAALASRPTALPRQVAIAQVGQ